MWGSLVAEEQKKDKGIYIQFCMSILTSPHIYHYGSTLPLIDPSYKFPLTDVLPSVVLGHCTIRHDEPQPEHSHQYLFT